MLPTRACIFNKNKKILYYHCVTLGNGICRTDGGTFSAAAASAEALDCVNPWASDGGVSHRHRESMLAYRKAC